MRGYYRIFVILAGCVLFLQAGCDEQATALKESGSERTVSAEEEFVEALEDEAVESDESSVETEEQAVADANEGAPEIRFEKVIHDLGKIGPGTNNVCEFGFTNVGTGLLKITKVSKTCGCTPFTLEKKEYTPGETGVLKVKYNAAKRAGSITKHLFVYSNDEANPKVELTLKGTIVMKVEHEPKKLNLVLKDENAGCPEIRLTSLDKQPFAIKSFKSTSECITVDYNPSAKSTEFILEPKVDIDKLRKRLNGRIDIGLTHPECQSVTISYSALAEYKTEPSAIIVRNAEPETPITREIYVLNNYGRDFEIESTSSQKGIIKVLNHEQDGGRCKFELELTPPAIKGSVRIFTDVLTVKIKDGQKVEISCRGFYSSEALKTSAQ